MQPWYLLLWVMTAFATREQQLRIDYLVTENAILREKVGLKRRLILSDSQRIRLAEKAKAIGRTGLKSLQTLFTPWKWQSKKRPAWQPKSLFWQSKKRPLETKFRMLAQLPQQLGS